MEPPRFYRLSAATPPFLEPLVRDRARDPDDFPRDYFVNAEDIFGHEIEEDPFLTVLYRSAFQMGYTMMAMPKGDLFWPSMGELRDLLPMWANVASGKDLTGKTPEEIAVEEDPLEFYRGRISEFYPEPLEVLARVQTLVVREQFEKVRLAGAALAARYALGSRLVAEMPLRDRNLDLRLAESPFRQGLTDAQWAMVVGDMAIKVRPSGSATPEVVKNGYSTDLYHAGLAAAPLSFWSNVSEAVRKGEGLFGWTGTFPPEDAPEDSDSAAYCPGAVNAEVVGYDTALLNHVAATAGYPALSKEQLEYYDGLYGRMPDVIKASIEREACEALLGAYLRSVAKYGYMNGYLDRRSASGVGLLRTLQRCYAQSFAFSLDKIFDLGLDDSTLMNGSYVLRTSLSSLWSLVSLNRAGLPMGMGVQKGFSRSLTDIFRSLEMDMQYLRDHKDKDQFQHQGDRGFAEAR